MKINSRVFALTASLTVLFAGNAMADQDQYSSDLAAKGRARMDKAECLILGAREAGVKAIGQLADDSDKKIGTLEKIKTADHSIPAVLLDKAQCVVVIPGDKKVGLAGWGANYGAGIAMFKDGDDLADPTFVKMTGGSYGPQIGVASTDRILLFLDSSCKQILQNGKSSLKLGGSLSVVAGPLGRNAEADTNLHLKNEILGYSHSKGLFAGATLDGAVLQADTKMTQAVAGSDVKRGLLEKVGHGIGGLFHHKSAKPSNPIQCDVNKDLEDLDEVQPAVASQDPAAAEQSGAAPAPAQQPAQTPAAQPDPVVVGSAPGAS